MHYDNLQLYRNKKKSVPTLLFSVVLMLWHSIFSNAILFSFCSSLIAKNIYLTDKIKNEYHIYEKTS
jgi:hypothetical protein